MLVRVSRNSTVMTKPVQQRLTSIQTFACCLSILHPCASHIHFSTFTFLADEGFLAWKSSSSSSSEDSSSLSTCQKEAKWSCQTSW